MVNLDIPDMENLTIRDYTFHECIGYGGYSAVYAVTSSKFATKFVAKVLLPKDNKVSSAWESFDCEVRALIQLDYPNIIRLYDHFHEKGLFFIILEYCSHGSLYNNVKHNGPLKGSQLLTVVKQLISAVYFAHKNNVAHCDIKPHNILFDEFGRVKLADFGISVVTRESELIQNSKCSPDFAPPEVIRREAHDMFKADMWSLGVTLYFAATGKLPFRYYNSKQMLSDMKNVGIDMTQETVPPILFYLIKEMVTYDPAQRISIQKAYQMIFSIQDNTPKQTIPLGRYSSFKREDQKDNIHFYTGSQDEQHEVILKPVTIVSFKNIVCNTLLKRKRPNEVRRVCLSARPI
ncbi:CAMK family protein kinase [Tritrichomonas foetus]|uniref:CAMK family protein kinase n=1 Tax=Tritrichomonas foetus TaxID=1144522 RepID=A0A1J4J4J2_9EUKA|nr:CAMK family protein kinase [Tritrichomonas foetus]|eukprot:OHS93071.1 CAMK family protein kinase [Tritrichomonas foetus]